MPWEDEANVEGSELGGVGSDFGEKRSVNCTGLVQYRFGRGKVLYILTVFVEATLCWKSSIFLSFVKRFFDYLHKMSIKYSKNRFANGRKMDDFRSRLILYQNI